MRSVASLHPDQLRDELRALSRRNAETLTRTTERIGLDFAQYSSAMQYPSRNGLTRLRAHLDAYYRQHP